MSTITATENPLKKQFDRIPYQVVHAVRGHIRVQINRLGRDSEYAERLEHLVKSFNFVTDAYVNPKARSVAIDFEASAVSIEAVQRSLVSAIQQASTPAIPPHSTSSLAKRLGVAFQALNWHRSQPGFASWSMAKDPDSIAWSYDAASKSFYPIAYSSNSAAPPPSKGQQVLLALGEATSGKIGGILGRLAGEAL